VILVWFLALIGLVCLFALAAVAVFGAGQRPADSEPEDSFDLALSAVARLQSAAWRAVQELRELDSRGKE
jgi:hypothetical protein